jgi:hypothetical protein
MEIIITDERAWRGVGRPPSRVDPEVLRAVQSTYKTGQIGRITINNPGDKAAAMEFVTEARRAARAMGGVRMLFQPQTPETATTELRFRLVDKRMR